MRRAAIAIERAATTHAAETTTHGNRNNKTRTGVNTFRVGDLLQITNRLRNEFGVTGVVETTGSQFIWIKKTVTGKRYNKAYWNLDYHRPLLHGNRDETE